jgi:hypothetical protein
MGVVLVITFLYCLGFWLVFFKLKWIKFSMGWGVVSVFVGLHMILAFLVGLRFVTPFSASARIVQYTIQLIPASPNRHCLPPSWRRRIAR